MMTFCSFHPFKERKRALAGIDNISTVLVTGRKLMEGIGGVLMLATHANALPFLCSKELKVLDFQIRKNGDELLVKGSSLHYLLEVGVVHHCNLGLENLTEFVGGCSGHSIEDTSDNVRGNFVVANSIDDSLDSKTGLCDVFARKVGKADILEPLLKIATGFFVLGHHSIDHATKEREEIAPWHSLGSLSKSGMTLSLRVFSVNLCRNSSIH